MREEIIYAARRNRTNGWKWNEKAQRNVKWPGNGLSPARQKHEVTIVNFRLPFFSFLWMRLRWSKLHFDLSTAVCWSGLAWTVESCFCMFKFNQTRVSRDVFYRKENTKMSIVSKRRFRRGHYFNKLPIRCRCQCQCEHVMCPKKKSVSLKRIRCPANYSSFAPFFVACVSIFVRSNCAKKRWACLFLHRSENPLKTTTVAGNTVIMWCTWDCIPAKPKKKL